MIRFGFSIIDIIINEMTLFFYLTALETFCCDFQHSFYLLFLKSLNIFKN